MFQSLPSYFDVPFDVRHFDSHKHFSPKTSITFRVEIAKLDLAMQFFLLGGFAYTLRFLASRLSFPFRRHFASIFGATDGKSTRKKIPLIGSPLRVTNVRSTVHRFCFFQRQDFVSLLRVSTRIKGV